MRWKLEQYLLFENSIAKINNIDTAFEYKYKNNKAHFKIVITRLKIRKFTKGRTNNGYSWQSLEHLNKLYKANKVRIIPPEEVMQLLLANFEGCMPINDMRKV